MRFTSILQLFLTILAVSDAFIEFAKSRIYDELDFVNQKSVALNEYCWFGCDIYASYPKDSVVAKSIYIVTKDKKKSLSKANKKEKNGRKKPYSTKGNQVRFENGINGLKSAPLLIWVVQQNAPYYRNVEIYDAADMNRKAAPAQLITVMSAQPFVLTTNTFGPMTMSAFTAGFDAFDSADTCTRVLRQENQTTYQDLQVLVRSPLFTLVYDKFSYNNTIIAERASQNTVDTFDLGKPMFVTSPGYIGCSVREGDPPNGGVYTKTFRSSLYDDETVFNFKSNDTVSFVLSGDVSTDAEHPVTVDADGIEIWNAVDARNETAIDVKAKELSIKWTRNPAELDQYFMVRVEQDHGVSNTTTVEPIKTTTAPSGPKTTPTRPVPRTERTTTAKAEDPETTDASRHHTHGTTPSHGVQIQSTTAFHPKSSSTTTTSSRASSTTVFPTTSGANCESLFISIGLAALIIS